MEKVWKAEQKHEAERKKIEELQRELREERAREEMQRYAEDVGAVKYVGQGFILGQSLELKWRWCFFRQLIVAPNEMPVE